MIEIKSLCAFLVKAKKSTYASGDEGAKIEENDKSTTLVFEEGDFKYHDNYFGGEPYGGREVVFFRGEPIYIMTYYGQVNESVANVNEVYKILQKALSLVQEDSPYRGPKEYIEGDYLYSNNFTGEVKNFSGEETIKLKGEVIYRAKYIGGLVDQRR